MTPPAGRAQSMEGTPDARAAPRIDAGSGPTRALGRHEPDCWHHYRRWDFSDAAAGFRSRAAALARVIDMVRRRHVRSGRGALLRGAGERLSEVGRRIRLPDAGLWAVGRVHLRLDAAVDHS